MPSDGPRQNKQVAASKFPIHARRLLAHPSAAGTAFQQVSQTPGIPGKFVGEKSVKSGTEWLFTGRLLFLFCVVLGKLGESHDSVLAEENWSLAFRVSPAFQSSLA